MKFRQATKTARSHVAVRLFPTTSRASLSSPSLLNDGGGKRRVADRLRQILKGLQAQLLRVPAADWILGRGDLCQLVCRPRHHHECARLFISPRTHSAPRLAKSNPFSRVPTFIFCAGFPPVAAVLDVTSKGAEFLPMTLGVGGLGLMGYMMVVNRAFIVKAIATVARKLTRRR